MIFEKEVQKKLIKEILESSEDCLIFTGAGMGVDSGLQVFRGKEGLWETFPDAKDLDFNFQDLANPNNYLKYPEVVIPFYVKRYESYANSEPHWGHDLLLDYVNSLKGSYFVVTSNVDGHMEKAGFSTNNIYEEHGSINLWQCSHFECSFKSGIDGLVDISTYDRTNIENLRCSKCNSYLRPNLLMFMDLDWVSKKYDSQATKKAAYYYDLLDRKKSKVAVIEIGAGTELRMIRSAAEQAAEELNTKLIRINPGTLEPTEVNDNSIINVKMSALEGLVDIFN